jgi:alpha-maltose-1-phosphate synthase
MSPDRPPLRVLFVNGNLGGHITMHQNLRRAMGERGDVAAEFLDVPPADLVREGLATRIPGLAHADLDLKQLRYQLAVGAWVRRNLRSSIRQCDVLHVYPHDVALLSSGTVRRMPAVVSLDAPNSRSFMMLPYRRPTRWTPRIARPSMDLERRLFRASTLVVAQSDWAATALQQDYGVDPDRIRVIRFGIMPPKITSEPADGRPQITFVGRTMDRKGGWRLLRAFRAGLSDRSVLNLITQAKVPQGPGVRVFNDLVPGDPLLMKLLAQTAVFALPSDTDMSPYAVVEAMAIGLPVVACRVGGIDEMVEHGVTGFLLEPGDDKGLFDALATLIDNEDLRRRMGEAARFRFAERFDATQTTEALVRVLHETRAIFCERTCDIRS